MIVARVFPGQAEHAGRARRWVGALAATICPPVAADAELVASELVANALLHTRSGLADGTVTVAVAAGHDGVSIHVHDQGTPDYQPPRPHPAANGNGLAEVGRGLLIVTALSTTWDTTPLAQCPIGSVTSPVPGSSGRCTWCHLAHRPDMPDDDPSPLRGHGSHDAAEPSQS